MCLTALAWAIVLIWIPERLHSIDFLALLGAFLLLSFRFLGRRSLAHIISYRILPVASFVVLFAVYSVQSTRIHVKIRADNPPLAELAHSMRLSGAGFFGDPVRWLGNPTVKLNRGRHPIGAVIAAAETATGAKFRGGFYCGVGLTWVDSFRDKPLYFYDIILHQRRSVR